MKTRDAIFIVVFTISTIFFWSSICMLNYLYFSGVVLAILLLVVKESWVLGHAELIILHQIVNLHDQIREAVLVLNVARSELHHVEVLDDLEQLLIELVKFFVEEAIFIIEAVLKLNWCHSL